MSGLQAVTLHDLAKLPRWVAWQTEDRPKGGPTKVPYNPTGTGKALADKPATWGNLHAAVARAATLPRPHGTGGVGIELGDMGNGTVLGGIDLDSCRDPTDTLQPWAAAVVDRLGSYAEVSPSGTGCKLFFLAAAADVATLAAVPKLLSPFLARQFKRKGDDHPEAIEFYLGNRYFAVTGEHLAATPAEMRPVPLDALRWVLDVAGPALKGDAPKAPPGQRQGARKTSGGAASGPPAQPAIQEGPGDPPGLLGRIEAKLTGSRTLAKRWGGDWSGLRDESGSGRAFALAAALRKAGFGKADTLAGLRLHPDTREWVTTKGDAADGRELARLWDHLEPPEPSKPEFQVKGSDMPATARGVCELLASGSGFYDRGGVMVQLVHPADGTMPVAAAVDVHGVVCEVHRLVQPMAWTGDTLKAVTLPERPAKMALAQRGWWNLPALDGVTTAPVLAGDGAILDRDGYDPGTRLWCAKVPALDVPDRPTQPQAAAALAKLRQVFRTFPFGDAPRVSAAVDGATVPVVDTGKPPLLDETAALAALLTAVCRPSLHLAPGFLVTAAALSGSGSGKGLLVRAINLIAFGVHPRAFTAGAEKGELDKRLTAELIEAAPSLFLDNVNGASLKSDTLASVMTERPARVRVLGKSQMVPLNSCAFVSLTGNGLAVSEDLARRFLFCNLDAQMEDPETREFAPGFLDRILDARPALLAAVLTIWRWGRQNPDGMTQGLRLGSFETWAEWVRDPLLTLGCADPVQRIQEAKAGDARRRQVYEFFDTWYAEHGEGHKPAKDLHEGVRAIADPHGHGRQFLTAFLDKLAGTRAAGFVLRRHKPDGKWSTTRYSLEIVDEAAVRARADARRAAEAHQPEPPTGYADDPGWTPNPDAWEAE